ncbi:serine hydrolase domain-containing protein [Streptomyces benahoarensis]|uniref:Beta-lactamase n=1 Tax=Streptomyces benahoarensis TaxID=2595054 RepID=A0A553ZMA0_9ACTN|nr:serine hydrolase domain-containing protein [Streptomyces benahoarensis]TSB23692.1 beta-lactamase family protein [Streptomyces benahoarensis]TSB42570.1 beta-lactamase family protein [Streptomyces benahoarensis]
MADAVAAIEAPDVVVAVTRRGARTVLTGGTAPPPPGGRHALRYELGSLSKTFTVLLLAALVHDGALGTDDRLTAHLPRLAPPHRNAHRITLRHLATHTSGLPRVPRELLPGALLQPYANGYHGYGTERLLHSFARTRPRPPGTRWHYSNFGLALLGCALTRATGSAFPALLTRRVLAPLGLTGTALEPGATGTDALGHRADGRPHTHTLTWFRHPAPGGPLLFHMGATFGQQAFIGFHPATATGVAAVATRRGRACRPTGAAYELLYAPCGDGADAGG